MDERELVERCRAGDQGAFELIVKLHQVGACALACHIVQNRDDAQEIVQEAFFRAWQQIGTFRAHSSLKVWLYRIVLNLAFDFLRQRDRRKGLSYDGHFVQPDPPNPGKDFNNEELRQAVSRALAALPPKQGAMIVLRELEGLSYREIAAAMGCSIGTVMSTLYTVRRKLRERLKPYWEECGVQL